MNAKRNIELNFKRLNDEPYSLQYLFRPKEYDWPGDWEGRALLAFLHHYEINHELVPHFYDFLNMLPEKTNRDLYFGKLFDGKVADEQQLSGHNWYLRGLIQAYNSLSYDKARDYAKSVVENLYLPIKDWYFHYPLDGRREVGDVSGSITGTVDGWKLSSDVGCAFMCVDGLARYFDMTHDIRVFELLEVIIDCFMKTDLVKYKLQTHTTLTCLRGILWLYRTTRDKKYLEIVIEKFAFYEENGMTMTYENFNWFGRKDTWTEPCAVVDSFILALQLYHFTKLEKYKTLARRIWFNGLQFCQRENGGAGPNSCVTKEQGILKVLMYEAPFCCTMRYAEGLYEYYRHESHFTFNPNAETVKDEYGRMFTDDVMLVKFKGETVPIFSCNGIPRNEAGKLELYIFH